MMERVQPHIYTQSSFRCLISQPHAWVLHKLLFTASHPGFWQPAPVWISKGNRVRNRIHFFHPTATFTKLKLVKPVLLRTHLPALGSWYNSLCSHAISRAWNIFSRSKFGGNSDLGVWVGWISPDSLCSTVPTFPQVIMESKKSWKSGRVREDG